ncbi:MULTISPECIES: glutathione-regulated potassium-efflux system protein KefC [Cyanophyceae]|uniref:glutathione-regulated potassium-efflux system protein KefC n=1 Tax=Cyanophyceae TaxID=3028117 RepID=UPI001689DCC9|nr:MULTISPECIES: glutathione-regulated potassium-efflux system protein KefC [Cyanophyceae]MBD1915776.1 glutathione-regulated potassium-efflux system protein KefC [Phormidium sp. FACHB-77]MBD2030037.1 glutathione-regulated potassium-efflux system protein KefC [Phormidium sp. FACHB-322]MBD2052149.1 glutathione-regulated potassium-efflux system protein KefC [Leptolyngbya sp. FACHB-60]
MHSEDLFFQAFIYLMAAVLSVPFAKRLGLGSVLGYLIAGVIIGPFVLGLVGGEQQDDVMHFAEFGVVMMLFLIGLELRPSLLWQLRGPILGLGGLQVAVTTGAIALIAVLVGLPWTMALAIGMILSLSSTAIVLQTLNEKGLMRTEAGQASFSVLLFQDIAVIPMLALLPLLEMGQTAIGPHAAVLVATAEASGGLPAWQRTLLVMGAVGGIIVVGRFLMQPVFRFIADTRLREMFTATALLLVIGITLIMQMVGLSPALGTFVAGVVLADNEYRHELETDIEPFKGLLLGLFFISVGASIDFNVLARQPLLILGLVVGLMLLKGLVLLALGRFFRQSLSQNLMFAMALAQGGEFCFVLFSFAQQSRVLPTTITAPLVVVVALSMALTPLVMIANERLVQPRFVSQGEQREPDTIDDGETPVIIAGFGRFGQIVNRLLVANGIQTTVLDHDPATIDLLRQFGHKVFYGDSSRIELLYAAGAAEAKLFVMAIDDVERSLHTIDLVKQHFPHLKILARAIDRRHAYELLRRDVAVVERETFESALSLGAQALKLLGFRAYHAHRAARIFRHHDIKAMREMAQIEADMPKLVAKSQQLAADLKEVLQSDSFDLPREVDQAWDTTALKKYGA